MKQATMFDDGADLPLFSGTPQQPKKPTSKGGSHMYTYQARIAGRVINVKAKKADVEDVLHAIQRVVHINQYWQELTGVIGVDERESQGYLYSPLSTGRGQVADIDAYTADLEELLDSLPDPVTDVVGTIHKADAVFKKHLPVVDNRITPDEQAERRAKVEQWEQERQDKLNSFLDEYCQSRDTVEVPAGMMAVYLEITYDDSDPMTDYFCRHRQHGVDMLLAIVKKQARTERLAREVLSRYPELAQHSFTWHTENYSGGHGNYLMSEGIDELKGIQTYGGRTDPLFSYEVGFNAWTKGMHAYKDYPGTVQPPQATGEEVAAGDGFKVEHDRDWTWITFDSKPAEEVREALKAAGARFSRRRVAWYFRKHVELADLPI